MTSVYLDSYSSTYEYQNVFFCKGRYRVYVFVTSSLYESMAPSDPCEQNENSVDVIIGIGAGTLYKSLSIENTCTYTKPMYAVDSMINPGFSIPVAKKMLFSAWVRESDTQAPVYSHNEVQLDFGSGNSFTFKPRGPVIEGWQRYEGFFEAPPTATTMDLKLINNSDSIIYFDDIRIHPFNANMQTYVYDPVNLRLTAQLDANNYASFYEYDEEGTLIRTKVETREGVKTVTETRSAKQKNITDFQ